MGGGGDGGWWGGRGRGTAASLIILGVGPHAFFLGEGSTGRSTERKPFGLCLTLLSLSSLFCFKHPEDYGATWIQAWR